MKMHNDPTGVLSTCDLLIASPMVKHQSDPRHYHHYQHSDSSQSSSVYSSTSPSPKTSSTTVAAAAITPSTEPSINTLTDIDPQIAQHIEYELGLTKKNGIGTRKNAWGNLSYAELISKAITTSADQRLTLSEIYDWMIKYVPFFRNKVDRASSAGWKNSIRHNLSLHHRFKRIQSEGTGKSSWWIINPDDRSTSTNTMNETPLSSTTNGLKQTRHRSGPNSKSSPAAPKRLRTPRSTIKSSRTLTNTQRQQEATVQLNPPPEISSVPIYDTQHWSNQLDSDGMTTVNQLYDQDLYATSVNTPIPNSNSTGGIHSAYSFDDITTNYPSNTSSSANNPSEYSYQQHHYQHHHHHQPHTSYQHLHGSNYDAGSNNGYYQQQAVLNDHHLLPIDVYHTNNSLTYHLQQQNQPLDLNDDQPIYLRGHSISSHSSSSSLSPPMLSTTNHHLASSSSSASSSSNCSYPQKPLSSLSGGYLHPNSNGTITLYGHHHHSDIETGLQINRIDDENDDDDDDDDDLSTLVHHHHGMIDDPQQFPSFLPSNNNHQLFSHNESPASILRTVLKRPVVDMHNQQV